MLSLSFCRNMHYLCIAFRKKGKADAEDFSDAGFQCFASAFFSLYI